MNLLKKIKVVQLHYKKMGGLNTFRFIGLILFTPRNSIVFARIKGFARKIYLRNIPSDKQIFQQIFLREELNVKFSEIPSIIIDGGANIGMATLYFTMKYPDAKIFSIEPDNSNFLLLKRNTENSASIICYKNALWDTPAYLEIINKEAGNESFIVNEAKEYNGNDLLKGITLNEIINMNKLESIDLLKLDIEGSETELFKDNFESWLNKVNNLLVETHNWINPESERTVIAATKEMTFVGMRGEYHFFTRHQVV